jgi:hypothetical protein
MSRDPGLTLTATATRAGGTLFVQTTFKNQGRLSAYVYTRVRDRHLTPLPRRAYTAHATDAGALKLFLGVAPIPDGLCVFGRVEPWASFLRPGTGYTDFYEVPVPVPEWQPYAEPEGETDPVEVSRVIVETEWWVEPATLMVAPVTGAPGFYTACGHPSERATTTIELPEPVTISRRREGYTRF